MRTRVACCLPTCGRFLFSIPTINYPTVLGATWTLFSDKPIDTFLLSARITLLSTKFLNTRPTFCHSSPVLHVLTHLRRNLSLHCSFWPPRLLRQNLLGPKSIAPLCSPPPNRQSHCAYTHHILPDNRQNPDNSPAAF